MANKQQASTFLYYLPGLRKDAVTLAEVSRRGLAGRIGDCFHEDPLRQSVAVSDVRGGPDGLHGVLVVAMPADGSIPARSTYEKDSQEWIPTELHQVDGKPAYWIGWNRDARPNPAGLRRHKLVDGYDHELPDGNVWRCPTIRRAAVFPGVPCSCRANGQSVDRVPLSTYADVWERSQTWMGKELSGQGLTIAEQFAACVDALGTNYRIDREELSELGLCTDGSDGSMSAIIDSAIDGPWLRDAMSDDGDPQKKRAWELIASALASSSRGPEDSSPGTSLQQPS